MKRRSKKVKAADPKLRCIWSGKLIIPEDSTPSKTRYVFLAGQVQQVNPLDFEFLLSKQKAGSGCCGGSDKPVKYFEEI